MTKRDKYLSKLVNKSIGQKVHIFPSEKDRPPPNETALNHRSGNLMS